MKENRHEKDDQSDLAGARTGDVPGTVCLRQRRTQAYKMLDEKVSTEQYAIGFKKGNTELRDAVQAALFQPLQRRQGRRDRQKYSDYNLDAMLCLDKQTETTFDAAQAATSSSPHDLHRRLRRRYPPYGYMGADGEYTGFDLDLAQAVCDIYNWGARQDPH